MKFNINDHVRIRLTDRGRELLKDYSLAKYHSDDEGGWSRWQMWEIMGVFGPHLYTGCKVPFEPEIEIVTK